jgi:hypothetical protein
MGSKPSQNKNVRILSTEGPTIKMSTSLDSSHALFSHLNKNNSSSSNSNSGSYNTYNNRNHNSENYNKNQNVIYDSYNHRPASHTVGVVGASAVPNGRAFLKTSSSDPDLNWANRLNNTLNSNNATNIHNSGNSRHSADQSFKNGNIFQNNSTNTVINFVRSPPTPAPNLVFINNNNDNNNNTSSLEIYHTNEGVAEILTKTPLHFSPKSEHKFSNIPSLQPGVKPTQPAPIPPMKSQVISDLDLNQHI